MKTQTSQKSDLGEFLFQMCSDMNRSFAAALQKPPKDHCEQLQKEVNDKIKRDISAARQIK